MKTVLHISAADAQYWRQNAQGWQPCDDAGSGPLWVVINLPEEGFFEIQVPVLFGRDRKNYVQRQLVSRFPDTPYRTMLTPAGSGSLMNRLAPPLQTIFGVDAGPRLSALIAGAGAAPIAGVWATSMLLARLGSHKALPSELFVALPGAGALRIVYLKNRIPVFSRLIPGVTEAANMADEITRTVRHLENTHVLERSTGLRNVLFLHNETDIDPWLAQERLSRVPAPPPWRSATPADWRFALFDMAVSSPPGQLAPLAQRTRFVASKLRPRIYAAAALCVVLGAWATAGNLSEVASGYTSLAQAGSSTDQLNSQISDVEQKVASFGVSSEVVQSAVALDQGEIAAAPSLARHMVQLSGIVTALESVRLNQLSWRILDTGKDACSQSATGIAVPTAEKAGAAAAVPERRVEINFGVVWPASQTDRARAQDISNLSTRVSKMEGVHLLIDPAQALARGKLTGGGAMADNSSLDAQSWCLTLPGSGGVNPGLAKHE